MPGINDLDLKRWREYDDILTDSLWIIGERDNSGAHNNAYHGNFVPQIPNQLMRRFTKAGDVVLDPFVGHGTTLIEANSLGRHSIGIDLESEAAAAASQNMRQIPLGGGGIAKILIGNSVKETTRTEVINTLRDMGRQSVQLILLHPPYHDIISFGDTPDNLCNAPSVEAFTEQFGKVVENFSSLLDKGRHLAVVIGDKYTGGEWVPLGFYLMNETLKRDPTLTLKSILVKNMVNNRAKLNQENLWRYRALAHGFYIFKHEYILVFKKS